MAIGLETARHEWEDARQRVEAERRDGTHYARLLVQIDLVTDELRRRVGQTFSLADLARTYADAESWARGTLSERAATPGWTRDLTTVVAAAFQSYQRGALDYEP